MRRALVPVLLLGLAACIQDHKDVSIKADGSGTVTVTTMMKSEFVAQMKQMAAAFGGEPKELFGEEAAKNQVAKMGEGVSFVSVETLKKGDFEGMKAVYAFKDVNTLKLNVGSKMEMGSPGGPGGKTSASAGPEEPITFKLEKLAGGNMLLTVDDGRDAAKKEKPGDAPAKPEDPFGGPQGEAQLAMMKQMLKGMKLSVAVTVDGTLVKTNSPHVEGNTVTIMEMELDKLLEDPEILKKLAQTDSMEEAKKHLKGVKGVKINFEDKTTVEFK